MSDPTAKKLGEMTLRKVVSSWLYSSQGLGCLLTPEVPRTLPDPRPDAVGIRHVGGQLKGDFEVVSVVIRTSTKRFISACGEASAHSIQADRSYLACYLGTEEFNEDQVDVALHLGIGLINISSDEQCRRTVPAPLSHPQSGLRAALLHRLGLAICQLCGVSFSLFPENEQDDAVLWNESWADRFGRLRNESVYDRRHLCVDCVRNIRDIASNPGIT